MIDRGNTHKHFNEMNLIALAVVCTCRSTGLYDVCPSTHRRINRLGNLSRAPIGTLNTYKRRHKFYPLLRYNVAWEMAIDR